MREMKTSLIYCGREIRQSGMCCRERKPREVTPLFRKGRVVTVDVTLKKGERLREDYSKPRKW